MTGANAFAATVTQAGAAIDSTPRISTPLPPLTHEAAKDFEWIEGHLPRLAAQLVERCDDLGLPTTTEGALLLRSLASGLMCDDPTILRDQLAWQNRRAESSGVSAGSLIECLQHVVGDGPETVRQLIADAEAG